tara:strand:- start:1118 stop:1429 length:312 start_codon:yes stop_codon:yes gene_type:complete
MKENVQLSVPFKVVCVNARSKPKEIPHTKWLSKNKKYTVINVGTTLDGKLGFQLGEIILDKDCYPYNCFDSKRFVLPIQEDVLTLAEELSALGIEVQEEDIKS